MTGRRRRRELVEVSESFEATHPLPIRHGGVVGLDLDARLVEVVVDHLVAEGRARDRRLAEQLRRLAQRRRQLVHAGGVGVAGQRLGQLQFVLDAVEAAGDDRGDAEVRVDVAAGHAVLDPQRRAVADDAQRAGAVVDAPGDAGRREAALREPLVGVDGRRVEQRELAQRREDPGDPAAHQRAEAVRAVAGHHRRPGLVAHRQVDVAAVALALVELRHEGQRLAVVAGDRLRAVLVDGVLVGGLEHLRVAEGDLLLAEVALALHALAVQPGAVHRQPDVAQQRLEPARGEQVVVDVVVGRRREIAIAAGPGIPIRVVEDDELELGAGVGGESAVGEAARAGGSGCRAATGRRDRRSPTRGRPSRARSRAATGCAAASPTSGSSIMSP